MGVPEPDDASTDDVDWQSLPIHLLAQSFRQLDARSLAAVHQACASWHAASRDAASALRPRRLDSAGTPLGARFCQLSSVDLGGLVNRKELSDRDLEAALSGLQQLETLALDGLPGASARLVGRLAAALPRLRHVSLAADCGSVDDDALRSLDAACHLESLSCRRCPGISAAGLSLRRLTSLTALDLSECIQLRGGALLAALPGLPDSLRALNLSVLGSGSTGGGGAAAASALSVLSTLTALTSLDVSGRSAWGGGAQGGTMMRAIAALPSLARLHAADCGLGDEAVAPALTRLAGTLRELSLRHNVGIKDAETLGAVAALTGLSSLDITGCTLCIWLRGDWFASLAASMPRLAALRTSYPSPLTLVAPGYEVGSYSATVAVAGPAEHLGGGGGGDSSGGGGSDSSGDRGCGLEELELDGVRYGRLEVDDPLRYRQALSWPFLARLCLTDFKICHPGSLLHALHRAMPALRTLRLVGCAAMEGARSAGFAFLAALPSLRELHVERSAFCAGDWLSQLTQLTKLSLRAAQFAPPVGLDAACAELARLTGRGDLRALELEECGVRDSTLEALAGMTGLRSLSLRRNAALTSVDPLSQLTQLRVLDCRGCASLPAQVVEEARAWLPLTDVRRTQD